MPLPLDKIEKYGGNCDKKTLTDKGSQTCFRNGHRLMTDAVGLLICTVEFP